MFYKFMMKGLDNGSVRSWRPKPGEIVYVDAHALPRLEVTGLARLAIHFLSSEERRKLGRLAVERVLAQSGKEEVA